MTQMLTKDITRVGHNFEAGTLGSLGSVCRYGMRLARGGLSPARRRTAGCGVLGRLNKMGIVTNTTLLGEGGRRWATAWAVADEHLAVLDRLAQEKLRTNPAPSEFVRRNRRNRGGGVAQ
jgi:hypothetical protein